MLTPEQKDAIINNRGEKEAVAGTVTAYRVVRESGSCSLLSMTNKTPEELAKGCRDRFKDFIRIETKSGLAYE